MSAGGAGQEWVSLGTPAAELRLENTLPTGQTFRWRQTGEGEFLGLVGQRVVSEGTRRRCAGAAAGRRRAPPGGAP